MRDEKNKLFKLVSKGPDEDLSSRCKTRGMGTKVLGYPTSFVFIEDMEKPAQANYYQLGMVCANGDAIYIDAEHGTLIRGNDMYFLEERDAQGNYVVEGEYALNGLFFLYNERGKIGIYEFSMMIAEGAPYISDEMKEKLRDICENMKYETGHLFEKKEMAKENSSLDERIAEVRETQSVQSKDANKESKEADKER